MDNRGKKRSDADGDREHLDSPLRKKERLEEPSVENLQLVETDVRMEEGASTKCADRPPTGSSECLKVLTYNVWFNEQAALRDRMKAIGDIIKYHDYPHVVCFQEGTHLISDTFKKSDWWDRYNASDVPRDFRYFTMVLVRKDVPISNRMELPFENSVMGRGLQAARFTIGGTPFMVVTTHLESPNNGEMFSEPRIEQCRQSIEVLDEFKGSVVFTGDMNWQLEDGSMPLTVGWVDTWKALHPEEDGFTFDPKTNSMLSGKKHGGKRLDRVLAKLTEGWSPAEAEIVGNRPVEGAKVNIWSNGKNRALQAFPSDHYGLLVTFRKSEGNQSDVGGGSKSSEVKE